MERPPKNSLSFFKVFIEETSAKRLKIPPAYVSHMFGIVTLLRTVSLRDQYGNHWPVKLANVENQLYFEEGWVKFVKDNSLETGDFLFFQYDDDKVFHVKLTGKNGCDKKGVGTLKSEEREPETIDEDIDEQENQSHAEQINKEKEEGVQRRDGARHGKAKAPDYYGKDIFKSGISPLPDNPYFVTKIRVNRREELYIPKQVLKDYSIRKLPKQATLQDSHGRTWSTKLKSWKDGRKFYVGGWASFCRVNCAGDNDLCICEFVQKDQEDLILQLKVVPTSNNTKNRVRD